MWYYDEYTKKWYIDHKGDIERIDSCKDCKSRQELGIDACCGCAG